LSSRIPRWPPSTSNAPISTASGTTPSHQTLIRQITRLFRDGPLDRECGYVHAVYSIRTMSSPTGRSNLGQRYFVAIWPIVARRGSAPEGRYPPEGEYAPCSRPSDRFAPPPAGVLRPAFTAAARVARCTPGRDGDSPPRPGRNAHRNRPTLRRLSEYDFEANGLRTWITRRLRLLLSTAVPSYLPRW
jgi:hypothetical protein